MNNKKVGNSFEKQFCKFLSNQGYWVHYIEGAANTGSQPCDIFACKNNIPYMYDCKVLSNKSGNFSFDRIEENQRLAFKKYKKCGNIHFSLAILWNTNLYIIPVDCCNLDEKSLNLKDYEFFIRKEWENYTKFN